MKSQIQDYFHNQSSTINPMSGISPFPLNEIRREVREGMVRAVVFSLMVTSILFIVASFFWLREILVRTLILGGGIFLVCAVALILLNRGKFRFASALVISFLWLTVSIGSYTGGGFLAPIFSGYIIVILLAWILGGPRAGRSILFASILFSLFLFFAATNRQLPPSIEYSPASRLAVGIFFFVVAILLQWSAAKILEDAQERARTSDEKYRTFLENIPSITYINDMSEDALTLYVTPQVEKMIGYSQKELLEDPSLWFQIIHPDDKERVASENHRTVQTGEPFSMDYRLISRSGAILWVRDEAALVKNIHGEPQYWLGVWTDITERKNDEHTRETSLETLTIRNTQLLTASEISAAVTSILELNELLPKVVELIRSHFNYYYVCIFLVDEMSGKALLRAATGEMGKKMLAGGHSLLIGSSSMIGWCIANNQARIALDVGKEAVRFKNPLLPLTRSEIALPLRARGIVIGAMGIQSDIAAAFSDWDIQALQTMADQVANAIHTARLFDERSHLLREMESKNAELERFTYTVSHDLKSPLITIRGYLGYLRSDAEKGDMARFDKDLDRVIKSTETMQSLLQDLLDLSRIGRIINPTDKIPFGELVEETISLIMTPALRSKIQVEVHNPLPIIRADKTRMIEVLQNLISNSIKFMGRQAAPRISIGMSGHDPNNDYHVFYVKDNGIGIQPQYHEQVFGLFNRLNPDTKGTGIGLALVKRIIEVHGGRVWVESDGENKGSTFYFTLPPADSQP